MRFQDFLFEAREVVVEVGVTIPAGLGTLCGGVAGINHCGEHGGAGEESGYEEEGEGVQHLCFSCFAVGSEWVNKALDRTDTFSPRAKMMGLSAPEKESKTSQLERQRLEE